MTEGIDHGTFRCVDCEQRRAAEEAAAGHLTAIRSLSDAALVALTEAIQTIQKEARPPA